MPVDVAQKIQFFALDVISAVGLGRRFGMLDADADVDGYLGSCDDGLAAANVVLGLGLAPLVHSPWLGRFACPSPGDARGFGRMMATCFRFVDERAASPVDKRSDMLASFIRHGVEGADLRTEALEQVIAGSDTTSSGIRGTLLHLVANPPAYARLQAEVDAAAAAGTGPVISNARARQLPYLQAVVREGLRIFPPAANIFARDVPPAGDTVFVDGRPVFLPGGTSIGCSSYAMHHSEAVYGPDAKAFRPERWLDAEPDRLARMVRTNELIFGHGRYQCLGKQVARIEIGKVIFEVSARRAVPCRAAARLLTASHAAS